MNARTLLDLAAEYVRAQDGNEMAAGLAAAPVDLDEIAGRFDTALRQYVSRG